MSGGEIGVVNRLLNSHLVWKIPTFSDLPRHGGSRIWSPAIGTFPNVVKSTSAPSNWCYLVDNRWIHLSFASETNGPTAPEMVRIGAVNENGEEINVCECKWIPCYKRFDGINLIKQDELKLREQGAIPGGYLRLFCEIPSKTSKQLFNAVSLNESKTGLETLSQNFKDLLNKKKDSDITIKVQDREFYVHGIILKARSPEFDTLLSSRKFKDSKENVIEIQDSDPGVFEEFLHFIYSGKAENITPENVLGLYYVADKYKLSDLKHLCISFVKRNLSSENICDIVVFAKKYNETELYSLAINFFAKNMDQVLNTSKWLLFLRENPFEGNELCIQALKLGFVKKRPDKII